MPEHFDFDALFRGEGDFGGAAFAGKHRAGHALIAAEADASCVVNRHLRAGVNGQIREAAPRHPQHADPADIARFPQVELVTIEGVFGSWAAAQKKHFADGGEFDQIQAKK